MQACSGKINGENGKLHDQFEYLRLLHLKVNISPNNEAIFDIVILADSLASWLSWNICFVKIDQEFEETAAFKSRYL
jgi:hypothetical protein